MMRLNSIFLIFLVTTFYSCSVDYSFDNTKSDELELIIVNSILSPSNPIRIQLHKLDATNNNHSYRGLRDASILLKEDQSIIYEGKCNDSILQLNYYPKVNSTYSIEVSYSNLKTVSASTSVPPPITCRSDFSTEDNYEYRSMDIVSLDSFDVPPFSRISLWIMAYRIFEDDIELQYNELYANNVLIDKRNSTAGMEAVNNIVGSVYYNGFLRVKYKNLNLINNIVFTPYYVRVEDHDHNVPESTQTQMKIKLITASSEYDQFQRTLYDQKSMIVFENDFSSVFYQPKAVYSNIENGLGIFAAINEIDLLIDMPSNFE